MTDGPLDAEVLRAIVRAGRLSTAQLNRMCHSLFGQDLATISTASMPDQQAEEMIVYAVQYGLTRELASALLNITSESPAVQNLLLGEMTDNNQAGQNHYQLLRVEQKLDRVGERLENMERRMMAIEAAQVRQPMPTNNWDRLLVAIMVLATTALFLYNLVGVRP